MGDRANRSNRTNGTNGTNRVIGGCRSENLAGRVAETVPASENRSRNRSR